MCGRYGFAKPKDKVKKRFNLKKLPDDLPLLYNIAPQQDVPAVLNEACDELQMVRWGLVPHWSPSEKFKLNLINAKCETIADKPIFKGLLKSKRCLVLAEAFYEWKVEEEGKQPYRILLKSGEPFAFAGIWDRWEKDGRCVTTCCIITTSANDLVKDIHDRMPVILPPEKEKDWLEAGSGRFEELLKPYDHRQMMCHKISKAVNHPGNATQDIIKAI